jgi:hypothetical protein
MRPSSGQIRRYVAPHSNTVAAHPNCKAVAAQQENDTQDKLRRIKRNSTHKVPEVTIPADHANALRERQMRVRRGGVEVEHVVEAALVEIARLRVGARVGAVEGLGTS